MIAGTALGAWTDLVHPGAGFSLLAVLAVGIWWIRGAYMRYQEAPEAVETRDLIYGARLLRALGVWAGVAFGATLLNVMTGTDFWCWPIWVAGGTWALTVKVAQRLVKRGEFVSSKALVVDAQM